MECSLNCSSWFLCPASALFHAMDASRYEEFHSTVPLLGVRGKPEGRGFEFRWGHLICFNLSNSSSRTMALGFTQPLTEMSTRRSFWVKARPEPRVDNFTAICEPISRECGIFVISQPYRPPWSVTEIALLCCVLIDSLCGLVIRVLGYRSGGPGSIPGTTTKKSSVSGTGSTQPREYNWGATW
jgi:hypothetical protein